jgi:hypothetical protein
MASRAHIRTPGSEFDCPDFCQESSGCFWKGTSNARAARRIVVGLTVVLTLFGAVQENLFAQQTSRPGWSQDDQQYPPDQQYDNGQPPYGDPNQAYGQNGYGPPSQPLNAAQIEQLVAPIALYPDALVAQVLAASTYPRQVVEADRWRQAQGYASAGQIAMGADVQNWDPSVKALTAFPQVLAEMDGNLQWTTDLGNAYYNQPQDVMEAVQIMRQRAQAAGSLQSTPQESLVYDQGNIELIPANPQVVYVRAYNPWTVYGASISPYPGFLLLGAIGSFIGGLPLRYGVGIAMAAFAHTPWGWLAWGLNWLTQNVLFNHSNYFTHSSTVADWGFPHMGLHAYSNRREFPGSWNRSNWTRRSWGGWSSDRPSNQQFFHSPSPNRYADNWARSNDGFRSFGHDSFGRDSSRTPWQSFDRSRTPANRPQQDLYARNRGSYRAPERGDNRRPYSTYGNSLPSYRAPGANFQRGRFGEGSSSAYARSNFGFSNKSNHSHGLHLFGGGHNEKNFGGGSKFQRVHIGHASKGFHGGKSFGGSHFRGGGHSGGHGGGHHH